MTLLSESSITWLIFQGDNLIIKKIHTSPLLTTDDIANLNWPALNPLELEYVDNTMVYCTEITDNYTLPHSLELIPLKKALERLASINNNWCRLAVKARAITNWDRNHQYCGRCGGKTITHPHIFERLCTSCSLTFYPRISPSVIVRITRGDEILMARGHHFAPGVYGLIAGFIEAGENIEETIHREVKEEVNISIKNLRYFGSQPWPFPDSLMIAFTAEYASGELVIDNKEIETAGWYRFDNLPGRPSTRLSIANQLIEEYIKGVTRGRL